MAVYVDILGNTAKIHHGVWEGINPELTDHLNRQEKENRRHFAGSDPDPDHTSASLMANYHNGKISHRDPTPPPYHDPTVEY